MQYVVVVDDGKRPNFLEHSFHSNSLYLISLFLLNSRNFSLVSSFPIPLAQNLLSPKIFWSLSSPISPSSLKVGVPLLL